MVRLAGGWLFDQVMIGWDVTVLTTDRADARPLRILGVGTANLEIVLDRQVRGSCLQAVAVDADLYDADARIRRLVHEAIESETDVRLWGEGWPADLDDTAGPVWHRLSVAARAFKAQALAAAAVPPDPGEVDRGVPPGEDQAPQRRPGVLSARQRPPASSMTACLVRGGLPRRCGAGTSGCARPWAR